MQFLDTSKPKTEEKDGATAEPEFEIEIKDDTPPEDQGRAEMATPPGDVTDDELNQYSKGRARERIQQLGKGIHDERRKKEKAERELQEAVRVAQQIAEENKRLQGSLVTNHNVLIKHAQNSAASEIVEAQREYKVAYDLGDADAISKAAMKLNAAQIKADRANHFQQATVQTENKSVQTQQIQTAPNVDAKTREWQERNTWFGSDKKMTAYALGLHDELVESGIPVSSDEYYKRINADVQERFPEAFAGQHASAQTSQRPKSNVVASATRSTAPKKIVLTQSQVAIAKKLGVPLEVYAKHAAAEMSK